MLSDSSRLPGRTDGCARSARKVRFTFLVLLQNFSRRDAELGIGLPAPNSFGTCLAAPPINFSFRGSYSEKWANVPAFQNLPGRPARAPPAA